MIGSFLVNNIVICDEKHVKKNIYLLEKCYSVYRMENGPVVIILSSFVSANSCKYNSNTGFPAFVYIIY